MTENRLDEIAIAFEDWRRDNVKSMYKVVAKDAPKQFVHYSVKENEEILHFKTSKKLFQYFKRKIYANREQTNG